MAAAAAAPPPPQPQAFAVTKEVPLTADLLLVSWCPTMDLVVVVASDGQLHLRRMDWQLLWATSPEVRVGRVLGVC
jgi:anaphase-promoting complex subunit 4